MRTVRIDDYPYGSPVYNRQDCRDAISYVCEVFKKYGVTFMLGVIPLVIIDDDLKFLNTVIPPNCMTVMHGFTHGFNHKSWKTITDTWPTGGEFSGMSMEEIAENYKKADTILSRLTTYNRENFIAPFNCYTQELVDVLNANSVKYLHTCDKEYEAYGYEKMNHGNITTKISRYKVSYDYAGLVANLEKWDGSQITLHWMYDMRKPNWKDGYVSLCKRIAAEHC